MQEKEGKRKIVLQGWIKRKKKHLIFCLIKINEYSWLYQKYFPVIKKYFFEFQIPIFPFFNSQKLYF